MKFSKEQLEFINDILEIDCLEEESDKDILQGIADEALSFEAEEVVAKGSIVTKEGRIATDLVTEIGRELPVEDDDFFEISVPAKKEEMDHLLAVLKRICLEGNYDIVDINNPLFHKELHSLSYVQFGAFEGPETVTIELHFDAPHAIIVDYWNHGKPIQAEFTQYCKKVGLASAKEIIEEIFGDSKIPDLSNWTDITESIYKQNIYDAICGRLGYEPYKRKISDGKAFPYKILTAEEMNFLRFNGYFLHGFNDFTEDSEKEKLHFEFDQYGLICQKLGFEPVDYPYLPENEQLEKTENNLPNAWSVLTLEEMQFIEDNHYQDTKPHILNDVDYAIMKICKREDREAGSAIAICLACKEYDIYYDVETFLEENPEAGVDRIFDYIYTLVPPLEIIDDEEC